MFNLTAEDREIILNSGIDFSVLCGRRVLITGATGLIGKNLTAVLLERGVQVLALVRNPAKAEKLFGCPNNLRILVGDVTETVSVDGGVDYIIHAASQTASKAFVSEPASTIRTALLGTENMLKLAREKRVKGFVYLSSMEIYGAPPTEEKITETHGAELDTMAVRSSYPESKRMCEAMCAAYAAQYGVPAMVIRLTQTFGPGVPYGDTRVFAEFARCVIEKRDIVLHTKGETKRNYLYTADAAAAILSVLLKGRPGEAYNAANESTYCSIAEMAELAAGMGGIAVRIELADESQYGFAPVLKMNLDASRLRSLGWLPRKDLRAMFETLIEDMRNNRG